MTHLEWYVLQECSNVPKENVSHLWLYVTIRKTVKRARMSSNSVVSIPYTILTLFKNLVITAPPDCEPGQLTCRQYIFNKTYCIPPHYRCDMNVDCIDGSDESECSKFLFKVKYGIFPPVYRLCASVLFAGIVPDFSIKLKRINKNEAWN